MLGPIRFEELAEREARGDSPRLLVNTTLFNNGRRLVFTTLPPAALQYEFFRISSDRWPAAASPPRFPPNSRCAGRRSSPRPQDLPSMCAPSPRRGGGGVGVLSPLVGPITFRVGEEELYWHTGDGGLYENQGVESILFAFLKRLQERKARRALIIAFESSYPFSVGSRRLTLRAEPFSLFTYDFSRIPSIMEERAGAYQALFFRSLQLEGVIPDPQTVRVIILRHTDAEWNADLSDLPEACRAEHPPLASPQAVKERIAEIPTRFWLPSECDRALLVTAAAKVVAQKEQAILNFLAGK